MSCYPLNTISHLLPFHKAFGLLLYFYPQRHIQLSFYPRPCFFRPPIPRWLWHHSFYSKSIMSLLETCSLSLPPKFFPVPRQSHILDYILSISPLTPLCSHICL